MVIGLVLAIVLVVIMHKMILRDNVSKNVNLELMGRTDGAMITLSTAPVTPLPTMLIIYAMVVVQTSRLGVTLPLKDVSPDVLSTQEQDLSLTMQILVSDNVCSLVVTAIL